MSTEEPKPRYRHRRLILAICCLSLFIVSLDATVVNVALPSIGKELKAGVSSLQWTLDAYTLVLPWKGAPRTSGARTSWRCDGAGTCPTLPCMPGRQRLR